MSVVLSRPARNKPGAGRGIALIVRRELFTYFTSASGYVVAALFLFAVGVWFVADAVGTSSRYSAEVLSRHIVNLSGFTMGVAVFISMRLIAEERRSGTLQLIMSSSLSEGQVIFAKWLSAMSFFGILLSLTLYMPALIYVRGKVAELHVLAGYFGVLLLASACIAVGTFASAIARSQLIAAVIAAVLLFILVAMWNLSPIVDGTLGEMLNYAALHNIHFRPFQNGIVSSRDVIYYASVTVVFLVLARNALEARRWST